MPAFLMGCPRRGKSTPGPRAVEVGGVTIVQLESSHYHHLALSSDGEVFSWGRGTLGLLGHGDEELVTAPTRIVALRAVRAVACGPYHSAALCEDGQLLMWGWSPLELPPSVPVGTAPAGGAMEEMSRQGQKASTHQLQSSNTRWC